MNILNSNTSAAFLRPTLSKKTRVIQALVIAGLGLGTSPAVLAQSCCGGGTAMKENCSMAADAAKGGQPGQGVAGTASGSAAGQRALCKAVQSVFDNYLKVQGALAQDSLEGVAGSAGAIAATVRGDSMKMLSARVAEQAETLAQAKDLASARAAFKPLSQSLIQYLKDHKVAGAYHVAYCPMAKASWLQTGETIMNPYMGKEMLHCGQFKS